MTPLPAKHLDPGVINSAKEMGPPIDPVFESELRERVKPWVAHFAAVTGIDVTPWRYAA